MILKTLQLQLILKLKRFISNRLVTPNITFQILLLFQKYVNLLLTACLPDPNLLKGCPRSRYPLDRR